MSGGSYDYLYIKIENVAESLRYLNQNKFRSAFQKILYLLADAMHDIEWVDSGDMSPGDENEAIEKLLAVFNADPEMLAKALAYDKLKESLEILLKS